MVLTLKSGRNICGLDGGNKYAVKTDRLVLMPGGKMAFVELKASGEKPRKLQQVRIKQLRKMGFMCFVVDGPEMISDVLDSIKGGVS